MYRILDKPGMSQVECCLDLPNVGTLPPNWASEANPTFQGLVKDRYAKLDAFQWVFDSLQPPVLRNKPFRGSKYHTTREVASGEFAGRPLAFTFPGNAEGTQDYHFLVETMVEMPLPSSLFDLTSGCAEILCETNDLTSLN